MRAGIATTGILTLWASVALAGVVTPWGGPERPEDREQRPRDPFDDPFHPLKDPGRDPGPDQGAAGGAPAPHQLSADWDWGERYFGQQFPVTLTVTNRCNSTQVTSIFIDGLPYLEFPDRVDVPPSDAGITVKGRVTLPGPPKPPPVPMPGDPGFGWVDPPDLPPQPLGTPPPVFHQPNFVSIEGTVVLWHPWGPDGENAQCDPERTEYAVTGHIHWGPPEPAEDEDAGPTTLARTDPCTVWWNTGEEPAQAKGDCTGPMRLLAEHFLGRVIPPYWQNAPAEWDWLVAFGGVGDKSIDELLAMKARAGAIMGR